MTKIKYRKHLCSIFILLISLLLGCSGNQDGKNNDTEGASKEKGEITEDTKVYILLNNNADTKKLFLESAGEGLQEKFQYNEETAICDREGMQISIEELQPGELLQIVYTQEKILKEVKAAEDTFVYDGITEFAIDAGQETITAAGSQYDYDENLKIFLGGELIPVSEIGQGNIICIRGRGTHIITLVASGIKNSDMTEKAGFWD